MTPLNKLKQKLSPKITFKKVRSDWPCSIWDNYLIMDMGDDGYQLYKIVPTFTFDDDALTLNDRQKRIDANIPEFEKDLE